jgi:hypothetical protein
MLSACALLDSRNDFFFRLISDVLCFFFVWDLYRNAFFFLWVYLLWRVQGYPLGYTSRASRLRIARWFFVL